MHHGAECSRLYRDGAKPGHQPLKESLLLVLIAVVDIGAACMAPDLGGDEEKPQPGNGQCRVIEFRRIGHRFAVKEHKLTVEVVGHHRQLKMDAIRVEAV